MKIITLTLNPAFDVHCTTNEFLAEHENIAEIASREAGGKGINISRALKANGCECISVVILGNENADEYKQMLAPYGLMLKELTVNGRIRENITVHPENSTETRLSFKGFSVVDSLIDDVKQLLNNYIESGDIVTFTGTSPTGLSTNSVKQLIKYLNSVGVKCVIDSRSFTLEDIIECKPYLIKPNQEEISKYLGREVNSFEEIIESAKNINGKGVENVMVSMGSSGSLLVNNTGVYVAVPPKIKAVSTVGAGDSSIAGYLFALLNNCDILECLKSAVSFGTAACLTSGTEPPNPEDIEKIIQLVTVKVL